MKETLTEAPALGGGEVSVAPTALEVAASLPSPVELAPADVEVGIVNEDVVKGPVPVPVGMYEDVEFALNEVKLFVTVEVATLWIVTKAVMVMVEVAVVVSATATKGRSVAVRTDDSFILMI